MYSYGPPHMAKQKQDDQLEHIYSSYVKIGDVTLKTWQKRWMIGRSGERGSGISLLAARHDDDDDDNIFIAMCSCLSVGYKNVRTPLFDDLVFWFPTAQTSARWHSWYLIMIFDKSVKIKSIEVNKKKINTGSIISKNEIKNRRSIIKNNNIYFNINLFPKRIFLNVILFIYLFLHLILTFSEFI